MEFVHWLLTLGPLKSERAVHDAELTIGKVEAFLSEQAVVKGLWIKLNEDYKDALRYSNPNTYYRIVEASSEFLRLRNDTQEQIIPYASVRKFRRSL